MVLHGTRARDAGRGKIPYRPRCVPASLDVDAEFLQCHKSVINSVTKL
jgi:hypothetical protein